MSYVSRELRKFVYTRANHTCEYCQTSQQISGAQMNVEHILPLALGGEDTAENLALACAWCNSYKGTQTHGRDPDTDESHPLFNPRTDEWTTHFTWREDGLMLLGLTPIGRATIHSLKMNNEYIVPARRYWVEA
ncbi:MAG: HNH endonuclease, partial [Anaerolineales bacterium]|nr:HNH endonuclease [Anaerolineales bacterium]